MATTKTYYTVTTRFEDGTIENIEFPALSFYDAYNQVTVHYADQGRSGFKILSAEPTAKPWDL